jgi:hypothetical protein
MQPRPAGSLPGIKALTARPECFYGEENILKPMSKSNPFFFGL